MKKILFIGLVFFLSMCTRYPDNRNKDRSPDAQIASDTVVHPDSRRDSANITNSHLERSQHDSDMTPANH